METRSRSSFHSAARLRCGPGPHHGRAKTQHQAASDTRLASTGVPLSGLPAATDWPGATNGPLTTHDAGHTSNRHHVGCHFRFCDDSALFCHQFTTLVAILRSATTVQHTPVATNSANSSKFISCKPSGKYPLIIAFSSKACFCQFSKNILSFEQASIEHGGDGAFYVYLRKKKN